MQEHVYTARDGSWPNWANWRIPVRGGKFVYFGSYPTMYEKQCVEVQFLMSAQDRVSVQRRR